MKVQFNSLIKKVGSNISIRSINNLTCLPHQSDLPTFMDTWHLVLQRVDQCYCFKIAVFVPWVQDFCSVFQWLGEKSCQICSSHLLVECSLLFGPHYLPQLPHSANISAPQQRESPQQQRPNVSLWMEREVVIFPAKPHSYVLREVGSS